MTNKSELYHLRNKEKRDSRIKETRNFILSKSLSSLMNNHKWFRIFEWIELNNSEFELKTLLSTDYQKVKHILELEESSILVDNSGKFIEFLELEQVILGNAMESKMILDDLNIEYIERMNKIIISGYRT